MPNTGPHSPVLGDFSPSRYCVPPEESLASQTKVFLDCANCISIHPGVCSASYAGKNGPVCIWCADGLPCPPQIEILNSGKSVRDRAAFIIRQLRRPKLFELCEEDRALPNSRPLTFSPVTVVAQEERSIVVNIRRPAPTAVLSQQTGNGIATPLDLPAAALLEEPMATEITPAPSSKSISTPAVRLCGMCHKKALSYNNVSNTCTDCQKQHGRPRPNGNGHKAQPQHKAAKSNGAHRDPTHGNGKIADNANSKINGNGAHPAQDRLDLLMAVVPLEAKVRFLTAWLAGTL